MYSDNEHRSVMVKWEMEWSKWKSAIDPQMS